MKRKHWFHSRRPQVQGETHLQVELLETRHLLSGVSFALTPLVQVSDTSPLLFDQSDIPGQAGRVFLNSEVEPQVAVDPTNPLHAVGVWQQDRWSGTSSRGIVAGVSNDGGVNWDIVAIPKLSPVLGGEFQRYSDPWVSFGPEGDLYVSALAVSLTGPFPATSAILAIKSTDDGHNWDDPITLAETTVPPGSDPIDLLHDKEAITADPTKPGYVYVIWDRLNHPPDDANFNAFHGFGFRGDTLFARSIDGGENWDTQVVFAPQANEQWIGHQIVVMPRTSAHPGRLVDLFSLEQGSGSQGVKSARDKLAVIYSDDQGTSWSQPVIVADQFDLEVSDPDTGAPVRVGEPLPDFAVDPNNGNLYAVWDDARFSKKFTHDSIAFSMSTDGGLTWSDAIQVNQTPTNISDGNQQAFVPSVAVADNGTVAVTYYDFRNNTAAPGLLTDYWIAHADSAFKNPASWSAENRLTDSSFNMENAAVSRGFFLGDYEGLAAAGDSFYALFAQAGADSSDPSNIWFRDPPPATSLLVQSSAPVSEPAVSVAAAWQSSAFAGRSLPSSAVVARSFGDTSARELAFGILGNDSRPTSLLSTRIDASRTPAQTAAESVVDQTVIAKLWDAEDQSQLSGTSTQCALDATFDWLAADPFAELPSAEIGVEV